MKLGSFQFLVLYALVKGLVLSASAAQEEQVFYDFDIEGGRLFDVLQDIKDQTDNEFIVSFDLAQVQGIQAVSGRYTLGQALALMLENTDLSGRLTAGGMVVITNADDMETFKGEDEMFRKNKSKLLAGCAVLACLTGQQGAAQAQEEKETTDEEEMVLELITVTGSIIPRTKGSQLITAVGEQEIRSRAATNAVSILDAIPINQSSTFSNTTTGANGLTNVAELRSLGPNSTLVLLNGRRIVRNPLTDAGVDLNTVPVAAISRVDVLSDGASSIYGTDAVAGVINFVTRPEFEGIEYNVTGLWSEVGGGDLTAGSIAAGFGSLDDDNWNVYVGGTWRERTPLVSADTSFANTSVIPERGQDFSLRQSFPANLAQFAPDGSVIVDASNPFAPDCMPPGSIPNPGRGCAYDADAAGVIELQNREEQVSFITRFTGMVGEHKATLEYFYAQSEITAGLAGTTFVFGEFDVSPDNPFFPGNGIIPGVAGLDPTLPITVESRFEPAGRRQTQNTTHTDRILGSLEGEIEGFTYELWGLRSTSQAQLSAVQGAVFRDAFYGAFSGQDGAPFLNPFGEQTPEGAAFIESVQFRGAFQNAESSLTSTGLTLGHDLFELPAGPVTAAVAFEYGRESTTFAVNPIVSDLEGAVGLREGENRSGRRERFSIVGEALAPLADGLEFNASVRWDDYSDFGSTVNPKVALSYQPVDFFEVHASFNTGFRAPTLYDLNSPSSLGTVLGATNDDPLLCPGGVVDTGAGGVELRDCDRRFNVLFGGNPDVQPETSTAFNIGVSFSFSDADTELGDLTINIDYWNYDIDNVIGTINAADAFADPATFSDFFVRCSEALPDFIDQTATCPIPGGGDPLAYILAANANVGQNRTDGVDFAVNWSKDFSFGIAQINYRGTWVNKFEFQQLPGGEFQDRAGVYLSGRPVIPYSHFISASLEDGPWRAEIQNRLLSGYEDCNGQCRIDEEFFNRVGTYSTFNAIFTYTFSEAVSVSAMVQNVFDTDPPFSNGGFLCSSCDLRFVNPVGRAFGITLTGRL